MKQKMIGEVDSSFYWLVCDLHTTSNFEVFRSGLLLVVIGELNQTD